MDDNIKMDFKKATV